MKKLLPIIVLAMLCALCFGSESDITLTYSQLKSSRFLDLSIYNPSLSYRLKLVQDKSGQFKLECPPFFCANIKDTLVLGELQDSGLFKLLLDPTTLITEGESLKHVQRPSMEPRLSGLGLLTNELDLIALTPVFGSSSPLGASMILKGTNCFAAILYASQNNSIINIGKQDLQISWNDLGNGKNMILTLLGARANAKINDIEIKSVIFLQNAWDTLLGGGTTEGFDLKLKSKDNTVVFQRRLGNRGVKPKSINAKEYPEDIIHLQYENPNMELDYKEETYRIPVYAGVSQKKEIEYTILAKLKHLKLEAIHNTSYDLDRGKVSESDFKAEMMYKEVTIQSGFTVNRISNAQDFLSEGYLSVNSSKAKLKVTKSKTTLEYTWEKDIEDIKVKVSVDQDRYLSISASIKGN